VVVQKDEKVVQQQTLGYGEKVEKVVQKDEKVVVVQKDEKVAGMNRIV
jgi:hypothetical protein